MTQIPPAMIAKEVVNQGGDATQALVAAALTTGIESNGDPQDKNPNSSACGLFQFLDSTWQGNGGGKYSSSACGATWQQQVTVFLNATNGDHFGAWRPDLVPGLDPNSVSSYGPDVRAPQAGSKVANAIASLEATGQFGFLGNVNVGKGGIGGSEGLGPGLGSQAASTAGSVAQGAAQAGLLGLSGLLATGANPLSWADALGRLLTELVTADFWKRIGLAVAGLVLVIGGVILFVSTTKTGQRIEGEAATAAVAA